MVPRISSSAIEGALTALQVPCSSCSTITGNCICVCVASCLPKVSVRMRTYSGLPERASFSRGTYRRADNTSRPTGGQTQYEDGPSLVSFEEFDLWGIHQTNASLIRAQNQKLS